MVYLRAIHLTLFTFAALTQASPLAHHKRIAQVIADAKTAWETACDNAGGGGQCNDLAVAAINSLLAAADPCAQQGFGDQMVGLAKQLNNDAEMIRLAQLWVQQPRNTPNSQSMPYCQSAPKNAELNGLFQCQFAGADLTTFAGGVKVGGAGTIPFGHSSPVSPPGSCPAHTSGPIPDGQQLNSITQDPGLGNVQGGAGASGSASATTDATSAAGSASASTSAASATPTDSADDGDDDDDCGDEPTVSVTVTATDSAAATATPTPISSSAAPSSSSSTTSTSFQLQNGKDAQALNAKFQTLTLSSPCTDGEGACINGGFAECSGGAFVALGCAAGTQCFALPLVNSPGTSVTCSTQGDALARIAATGATGGVDGTANGT